MQIMYAAPFLLTAAICFFLCAAALPMRKHALVVPVGVLAFGVGSLIAFIAIVLLADHVGYHGLGTWVCLIPSILGGLTASILCALFFRMIAFTLPRSLIATGLIAATFASSLVLLPFFSWAVAHFITLDRSNLTWMVITLTIWVFFPASCHRDLFELPKASGQILV